MDSSVQCNSITADKSRQSVAVFRRLLFKRVCEEHRASFQWPVSVVSCRGPEQALKLLSSIH